MLFHLSFLLWSYLRQEDKCVLYSFMSTKMEVLLQSELTECLVNARHWLLCMGADLTGDKCWGLREPQSCWRNMPITNSICYVVCSVQFSCSVMSDYFQPHGLQHTRVCCSSPTPGAWENSCPSSWWFNPTISSSVILFSSCLQSFPITGSFLMSPFFTSVGQRYWRFNFSISPSNEYSGLISYRMTEWISLQSKALSTDLSNTRVQNHQLFIAHHSLWCNCHIHTWQLEKS